MIGKSLAHCEILELLGKGGMGEVYRARDTKLNREVALKLLPEDLANDVERLARFRREAQVLASLNHPNIAGIHGLEEAEGKSFLIMELAEGEDLDQRLQRGALSLDESLAYARQIAQGLEEAHEKNIVHRDLKPANVMVSREGKVKILDFGLARAYAGDPLAEGDPATSPTITAAMTQVGVILGSAAYMSPEQAKGRQVDRRADIWAFGVVLFEMLTGKLLFEAETVSETMACVMKEPIDWDRLPSDLPYGVRALLERCLERDPKLRLRDIGEARIHLQDPKGSGALLSSISGPASVVAPEATASRMQWLPWALFAASCVALLFVVLSGGLGGGGGAEPAGVLRASLEAPVGHGFHLTGANPAPATISPDGERVVYGARDERGVHPLWLQELTQSGAVPLDGSAGAQYPFWSPDSRSVAYFADGALRIVDLDARTNREVTQASDGKGGTWFPDDTIVFTLNSGSGLVKVNAAGGDPIEITKLGDEPRADSHRHPRALPDGRSFLYAARTLNSNPDAPVAIMLGNLDGGESQHLMDADGQAEYANGHLLYLQDNALYARELDLSSLDLSGRPTQISSEVGDIRGAALSLFSSSREGDVVFHPGQRGEALPSLVWFGIDGERQEAMGDPAGFGYFDISPDAKRVVFSAYNNVRGQGDLWLHELETGVRTRLTFEEVDESFPVWSPDGTTVYYLRTDTEKQTILALELEGRDEPRVIYEGQGISGISDISPDGLTLSISVNDSASSALRALLLPVDASSAPVSVDQSAVQSLGARFSPDGRWIAYGTLESGSWSIYLKSYPPTVRKWQVSDREALWFDWASSGDRIYFQWAGPELFYRDLELSGSTPRIGRTEMLTNEFPSVLTGQHHFRITPDGQRILVSDVGGSEVLRPARLVWGWPTLVERSSSDR